MSRQYPWFSLTVFLAGKGITLSLVNEVHYSRKNGVEANPPVRKFIWFAVYFWRDNFNGRPLVKWEES